MVVPRLFQDIFDNKDYRRVLFTGEYSQLAIMSLPPNEELQVDLRSVDKIVLVFKGQATVAIQGGEEEDRVEIREGGMIGIEARTKHQVFNSGSEDLKLAVIYSPSQFLSDTVHGTRERAVLDPYANPEEE